MGNKWPMGDMWKTHMEKVGREVEDKSRSTQKQMEDKENKSTTTAIQMQDMWKTSGHDWETNGKQVRVKRKRLGRPVGHTC